MDYHKLKRLVSKDAETAMPVLNHLRSQIRLQGMRHRLPQVESMLLENPGDTAIVELYLHELLCLTIKQMGGGLYLGPTFKETVEGLSDDVKATLPGHTRAALLALAEMTPMPAPDARLLAHALSIEGALTNHFVDMKKEYRKLAMQHHPDRGGDNEKMAELNASRRQ